MIKNSEFKTYVHKLSSFREIRINAIGLMRAVFKSRIFPVNPFIIIIINIFTFLNGEVIKSQDVNSQNIDFLNENKKSINQKRETFIKSRGDGKKEEPDFIRVGREEKFLVLGASFGSPGSLNLNAGYYFDRFVVRGSGMYYNPNWNGTQFDFGYSIYKTSRVIFGFSLVAGNFHVNPFAPDINKGGQTRMVYDEFLPGYQNNPVTVSDLLIRSSIASQNPNVALALDYLYRTRQEMKFSQNYIGGAFDFYLDGFWLQLGLGIGRGDYRNPQLLIQMGYLFDFGKKDK